MQYIQEFKIITLGDSGVGKTSIIKRYCEKIFDDNNQSTIGINFSMKEMIVGRKNKIKLKLIDTCGQEKYRALAKTYYKHADVVLFVFSMNDKESFDAINWWIESFNINTDKEGIPKYLVGTKNDLEIKIEQSLIEELSQKNSIKFISTSAKKNNNIDQLFEEIGNELYLKFIKKGDLPQINLQINDNDDNKEIKKRNRCCKVNMTNL